MNNLIRNIFQNHELDFMKKKDYMFIDANIRVS